MSVLNHNIPSFKALVRKSHFTKNESDFETFLNLARFDQFSEAEIDKLFRSAIHGNIGPQQLEVNPNIAKVTAEQRNPRVVSSRSPVCANFSFVISLA